MATYSYPPYLLGSRRKDWRRLLYPPFEAKGAHTGTEARGKDVIVVEDEAYLRDLIADVLEADGHTARKASNGVEALEQVRKKKPNLILLDLMMPIMDGWEFMEVLKSNNEWANLPVVIITAVYDTKRTQQQTGVRAVITKPFDIDQLGEIVRIYAS